MKFGCVRLKKVCASIEDEDYPSDPNESQNMRIPTARRTSIIIHEQQVEYEVSL